MPMTTSTHSINSTKQPDVFAKETLFSGGLVKNAEQEETLKLERLRLEVQKGVAAYERGEYIELNSDADIDNLFKEIREEVKAKRKKK